ncbi:hypothetical protein BDV28DRAFT_163777 [Aspergillus coremiiformis]|uniref:Uncharacterized protein n=1 Tax=Aspergillus coremiiformis TaxID=138285 RepID=A0A5N6ZHT3_9EURO|nr:hypothetical protein BDV28DRAFT_163777 [Aspergillus coremiiformis]
MPSSSELALTGQYPPTTYRNLRDIARAIAATRERLATQDVSQYLSFKHVSPADFKDIDTHRSQLGAVRFTYYPDINTLLIKVPTRAHEVVHRNFDRKISSQFDAMNIDIDQFLSLGATRYVGPTASEKEADSSFTNPVFRPRDSDWPTLVIESGVSESMPRLRQDAAWWMANSRGQVQIVLLIKVTRDTKCMVIEKYVPEARVYPNTRAQALAGPDYRPALVSTTEVHQGAYPPYVQGPPVILEFQRVLGRPPVLPEGNI